MFTLNSNRVSHTLFNAFRTFILISVLFSFLWTKVAANCRFGDVCKVGYRDGDGDWHCNGTCPSHHRCTGGDGDSPIECNEGYQAPGTNNCSCIPCEPGYFNYQKAHKCDPCPPGTYQPNYASTKCIPCEPGWYAAGAASTCTKSPSGWTSYNKSAPLDMRDYHGKFQPVGQSNTGATMQAGYMGRFGFQMACHGNLYSTSGAAECTSCGENRAKDTHDQCLTDSLCDPGYFPVFMDMEASDYPDWRVSPWLVSPSDSNLCVPCPPGAWCNGRGPPVYPRWYSPDPDASEPVVKHFTTTWRASSPESISVAPNVDGHFTAIVGTNNTSEINCSAGGVYLDLEANQCHKCPPGYFCPVGTNSARHCDITIGMYQPSAGQVSCLQEPDPDRYKFITADATQIVRCESGWYPDMRELVCKVCPAGFKCPNGKLFPILCNNAKEYQDTAGQASCKTCSHERYVSGDRKACITCELGFYYDFMKDECAVCPGGYYCDNGRFAKRCDPNTWSNIGETECHLCEVDGIQEPEGTNIKVPGFIPPLRNRCVTCDDGYYVDFDLGTCRPCERGFRCPDGVRKMSCGVERIYRNEKIYTINNRSKFQDELAQPTCKDCDLFVARNSTVCKGCLSGEFLDEDGYCRPCPAGYFCENGDRQPCPLGTYTNGGGADRCHPCDNGLTDILRTRCNVCEEGKFSVLESTDGFTCKPCEAGNYCTNGYMKPCEKGFYAPESSPRCLECYNGIISSTKSACTPCADGSFLSSDRAKCVPCPSGNFCRNGKVYTCGPGTYSTGSASSCSICKGFTDEARTLCKEGVNGAMETYSQRLSNNDFWAVGGPFLGIFVIIIIIDSCVRGCLFWPKDMVDPDRKKRLEKEAENKESHRKEQDAVKRVLQAGGLDKLGYERAKYAKGRKDAGDKLRRKAKESYEKAKRAEILKNGLPPPASIGPPDLSSPSTGPVRGAPNSMRGPASLRGGPPSMRGGPPSMRAGPPSMRGRK